MLTTDEMLTAAKARSVLLDAVAAFARGDELGFEAAVQSAGAFGAGMVIRDTAITLANAVAADEDGVLAWVARREKALAKFRELHRRKDAAGRDTS